MNISYKGIEKVLAPKLQGKLDAKFAKLSKLLEQRGPKEAHVVVTTVRHMCKAEIEMQFYGHPLVGIASDADLFTALWNGLEKLEMQALKERAKWREKQRRGDLQPKAASAAKSVEAKPAKGKNGGSPKANHKPAAKVELVGVLAGSGRSSQKAQRIFRVNQDEDHKPMSLDEALLVIEHDQDYMVYRDSGSQGVSVLVRRKDGHFDLIES